jgi:hypothetical protein
MSAPDFERVGNHKCEFTRLKAIGPAAGGWDSTHPHTKQRDFELRAVSWQGNGIHYQEAL